MEFDGDVLRRVGCLEGGGGRRGEVCDGSLDGYNGRGRMSSWRRNVVGGGVGHVRIGALLAHAEHHLCQSPTKQPNNQEPKRQMQRQEVRGVRYSHLCVVYKADDALSWNSFVRGERDKIPQEIHLDFPLRELVRATWGSVTLANGVAPSSEGSTLG